PAHQLTVAVRTGEIGREFLHVAEPQNPASAPPRRGFALDTQLPVAERVSGHGPRPSRESGERLRQDPDRSHAHAPDGGAGLAWLAHVCAATRGATGEKCETRN